MLTLNALIEAAIAARRVDPHKGESVVYLCEQDREYTPIVDFGLERDQTGAIGLVSTRLLSTQTSTVGE